MLSVDLIRSRLANSLAGSESLESFEQWLSRESDSLRFNDAELLDLADSILNALQVYLDNLVDEKSVKAELLQILLNRDEVVELEVSFEFEDDHSPRIRPNPPKVAGSQIVVAFGALPA